MKAIFKREFKSYFNGMTGYILVAFLCLMGGLYFLAGCLSYGSPEFSYYVLYNTCFVFLVFVPVLTMRSFAEERHMKTDQLLLTSPVSLGGVVLGKFFAMLAVFAIPVAVFATMPLVLSAFGAVNLAASYGALLAYLLMGASCIAIGMFISCQTENQLIACVGTFAVLLLCYLMEGIQTLFTVGSTLALVVFVVLLAVGCLIVGLRTRSLTFACGVFCVGCVVLMVLFRLRVSALTSAFSSVLGALCLFTPLTNFVSQMFSLPDLIYYLSITGVFLFFTMQSLEKRRWS